MPKLYHGSQPRATLLALCRTLRHNTTDAELLLWKLLRARQVAGAKFRRQHQVGNFILDFYWPGGKLAVEVDGSQHFTVAGLSSDKARTAYLTGEGITVVRFDNLQVPNQTEAAVETIWEAVVALTPTLSQGARE